MKNLIYILFIVGTICFSQEICTNGIDDDGDGLIDLNDSDCQCIEPQNLIPNGSFEQYESSGVGFDYPTSTGQITKALHWINPTNAHVTLTAFADAYHQNGYNDLGNITFPDGRGAAGVKHQIQTFSESIDGQTVNNRIFFYKELLGNNLDQTLLPNRTYVFSAYVFRKNTNDIVTWPQLRVALWGKTGATLPFQLDYGACPDGELGYQKLIALPFTPKNQWVKVSGEFTVEQEINGIIVGIDCGIPTRYYDLPGTKRLGFDHFEIKQKSEDLSLESSGPVCEDNVYLTAQTNSSFVPTSYQWYQDGVAIPNATSSFLELNNTSAEAYYSVRAMNALSCRNSTGLSFYQPEFKLNYELAIDDVNRSAQMTILWNPDNYTFSVDGENFTANPVFTNIPIGENFIYVKNRSNCILKKIPFAIFELYNVFTPNGDGFNDTWLIKGLQNYPGAKIQVFDKTGTQKLNYTIPENIDKYEWTGDNLPSGTYWYIIQINTERKIKGSVTIKRK